MHETLPLTQETIATQKIIEEFLADLLKNQYATGVITVNVQGGRIVSMRKSIERMIQMKTLIGTSGV